MLKRQRPIEYIISDIFYDFKLLMGKDSVGDERVLNKVDTKKILGINLGEAFVSINCEEFNLRNWRPRTPPRLVQPFLKVGVHLLGK